MKFILGTKLNMTEIFDESGVVHPGTVISAGPLTVTQVKDSKKDGYKAVQVGFGTQKDKNVAKPQKGHTKDLGNFKLFKEFRTDAALNVGDKIDVSAFKAGDVITISAISKGKGFQGGVKRHGFAGGRRTHGQKHSEREPGAIGGAGGRAGGRVAKGLRMAGRMGGDKITIKNVHVVQVNPETNTLVIRGAVPGIRGTLVEVVG
jgi:large subunit ribosomal protein L3